MKTISIDSEEEKIRELVIEWNELLARENYAEALEFILYDNTQKIDGQQWVWTPEKLEAAVNTYGMPQLSKEEVEREFGAGSADYKVTSLRQAPPEGFAESGRKIDISIELFDKAITPERAKLWGVAALDYENIIGEVLYDGVPLNGEISDLTAQFWLKKTDAENMTLIFRDLHVM